MKKLFRKLFVTNWEEYYKNDNVDYLSYFTQFSWFCDYGNNPKLWWNIYVSNQNKKDHGTWWYNFKRSKLFWCIILIFVIKILYPNLTLLSLINIMKP